MSRPRLAIVAGDFHTDLCEAMIASARAETEREGAEVIAEIRVSGSYEVPLAVDGLLSRGQCDALVVLGYIEKGETLHGEVMGHVVHAAIVQLSLQYKRPIGVGIIGPGATREQAEARKESYAAAAVRAALRNLTPHGHPRR